MNGVGSFRCIEVSDREYEVDGLRHVTVHSPALGRRADLTCWVPDGPGPFPIVILLHGVYGSHWIWAYKAGVHHVAARLVEAGDIPPMVLALPSDGLWGDGSGYVRGPGGDVATWITDEVPEAVSHAVPGAEPGRALFVAGLSMGGFGALRLVAAQPARFRAAAGLSSITELEQLRDFATDPVIDHGVAQADQRLAPALIAARDALPPLRFECGTDDALLAANRLLHEELDAAGVAHVYEEHPGPHDWPYWRARIGATLRFFGDTLA